MLKKTSIKPVQKKIILAAYDDWKAGKKTAYRIGKDANCSWATAKRYLKQFDGQIEEKQTEMLEKIDIEGINALIEEKQVSLWQKITRKLQSLKLS